MHDGLLNWAPSFDPRSKNYAVADVVRSDVRRNKMWRTGPILDQGREGACVGFGWTAEILATPVAVDLSKIAPTVPHEPNAFARNLYHLAQTLDSTPGEDYDGTSVLAGAKATRKLGFLKEYRWAFNTDDVINAIIHKGPVVLGVEWRYDMYSPQDGQLKVTGEVVGGHCITAVGYLTAKSSRSGEEAVVLQNSWGSDWGVNGLAEITVPDLAALLANDGEACVPTRRSYGRV